MTNSARFIAANSQRFPLVQESGNSSQQLVRSLRRSDPTSPNQPKSLADPALIIALPLHFLNVYLAYVG